MLKNEKNLLKEYIGLFTEKRTTDHYKIVCSKCDDVISQCRCAGDKKVTYDTCEKCSSQSIDEVDMPEDEEELDEVNVVANISGFTAPLGMNPSEASPKKRATWK